jgi:hypothetical protein
MKRLIAKFQVSDHLDDAQLSHLIQFFSGLERALDELGERYHLRGRRFTAEYSGLW